MFVRFVNTEEDGDILDLETVPVCRVSLSTRTGCFVHCSATSSNAEWIAYADQRSFRLFHISTVIYTILYCISFRQCYKVHSSD